MKVLVIGGGGREHALIWKISKSLRVKEIFCAPGNGGISTLAKCVDIQPHDIDGLISFVTNNRIELVVVGPELPLSLGIVDRMSSKGIRAFGPSAGAARLESSKVFSKEFMRRNNIPTARWESFSDAKEAKKFSGGFPLPCVVKAEGLAAGKGVLICLTRDELIDAVSETMERKTFGDAGNRIIIEEFIEGEEASFLVLSDGKTVLPLPTSQDHKRIFDNDLGPNTGGMGAYSPAPVVTAEIEKKIMEKIINPSIKGMAYEGCLYKGILYAGVMIRNGEPYTLEFNVRFGDPEAQPLLMRLDSDLIDIMEACIDGNLHAVKPVWKKEASVCVVLAAGGYPGNYEKGKIISGLEKLDDRQNAIAFHAGTKKDGNNFVTSGGRVLGITALGDTIPDAIKHAYAGIGKINFEGMQYRKDIGRKALKN